MKKLSLLLLLSVFIFCGCSDDDDTKTYILSLPNYETHTLDMGDQENPDDSWSVFRTPQQPKPTRNTQS